MPDPDVIVVGGGVVGATLAYVCAREGARTLLLDRADPGRATDAGAGIITSATPTPHDVLFELAVRACDYYPELLRQVDADGGGDTSYARCGALRVAVTPDELAPIAAFAALVEARRLRFGRPAAGDVRELAPDETQRLFPPLARPLRAMYDRTAARVDGRLLAQALLRAAVRHTFETARVSVDRLLIEAGRLAGVASGAMEHRAGHVVIAGGAWSAAFAEALGAPLAVVPQRGQIIHLDVGPPRAGGPPTGDWPVALGFHDHYLVTWQDNRVVAGASRETGSGFDVRTTAAAVHDVLGEALRVAPGLAGAGLRGIRVGLRPMSPDGLPILGPVPGVAGAWVATGHGPSGLTLGPYSARVVADMILGRAADLDLAPFALGRFLAPPRRT
jgi:D-amino-acid dehydrogenase